MLQSPGCLEPSELEEVGASPRRASWEPNPAGSLILTSGLRAVRRMNFAFLNRQPLVTVMAAPRTCTGDLLHLFMSKPLQHRGPWGLSLQSQLGLLV